MISSRPTRRLFTTGLCAAIAAPAYLRSSAARAAGKKIRVLTNWFAEAEGL